MAWSAHGSYRLHRQGDLLWIEAAHSWNAECMQELASELAALPRPAARWGLVVDCRQWEGITPDAVEIWLAMFETAVLHGLGAAAAVMPSGFHQRMVEPMERRMQEWAPVQSFLDLESALEWLAGRGFRRGPDGPP